MAVQGKVKMTGSICPHNLNPPDGAAAWMKSRAGQYVTIVDGPIDGGDHGLPCSSPYYEVCIEDARQPYDKTAAPVVCRHEIEIGD